MRSERLGMVILNLILITASYSLTGSLNADDSDCCCNQQRTITHMPLDLQAQFPNQDYYFGIEISGTFGAKKPIKIDSISPQFRVTELGQQNCNGNLFRSQNTFGDEPTFESFKYEALFGSAAFLSSFAFRIGSQSAKHQKVDLLDAFLDSSVDAAAVIGATSLFSPGRVNNAIGRNFLEAMLRHAAFSFLYGKDDKDKAGDLLDRLAVALGAGIIEGLTPQDVSVLILCKSGDFKADVCNTAIQAAQHGLSQGIQEMLAKLLETSHNRKNFSQPISIQVGRSFLDGAAWGGAESLAATLFLGSTRPIPKYILDEAQRRTEDAHFDFMSQNYAHMCLQDTVYRYGGLYGLMGPGWAYTMGSTIHSSDDMYVRDTGVEKVMHENTHCVQYMKYGLLGFFLKPYEGYLWQLAFTGRADCHPEDPNLKCNAVEGEAVEVEEVDSDE